MKNFHRNWRRRPVISDAKMKKWLLDRGSLTRRIMGKCNFFSVENLRQRHEKPHIDEMDGRFALSREVFLCCRKKPVVFAHSVIASNHLRGAWKGLTSLGKKPLGAALFSDPKTKRGVLEFRKISRRHPLYPKAARFLKKPPKTLWARRSLFFRIKKPILVTEVFLPGILDLK